MKRIKDPVYGYIEISRAFVDKVVDTPLFQRLRRIVQTSYCSLYPSASHTRFAHSLGVYFLGDVAARCIEKQSLDSLCREEGREIGLVKRRCKRYLDVFRIACLLHDIGHAPFSHTGEKFFARGEDKNGCECAVDLVALLCKALRADDHFRQELTRHKPASAEHEIMSAMIGVAKFRLLKTRFEKEFFARAITGYQYDEIARQRIKNGDGVNLSFLNCLIQLLNSSVVDVDRLDYVIRDAKVIGFESVSLDYRRLLGGLRIVCRDNECRAVYNKQAVGILENVVFAHDAEKKWVQNHPAIGYEMNLLSHAIDDVRRVYAKDLFCQKALMEKGMEVKGFRVRLLADDDLIFMMKNVNPPTADIRKYFDRGLRERAFWKSEAEFEALFNVKDWSVNDQQALQVLFDCQLSALEKNSSNGRRIDGAAIRFLKEDVAAAEESAGTCDTKVKAASEMIVQRKKLMLSLALVFEEFARKHAMECDFLIQKGNPFKSGFAKADLGDTLIQLSVLGDPVELRAVTQILNRDKPNRALGVFYVFCRKDCGMKETWAADLVYKLKLFVAGHSTDIRKHFRREIEALVEKTDS